MQKNVFGKQSKRQENWAIIISEATMIKFIFGKVRNMIPLL